MLKRTGTVASGVTAGLLALSPLAYAGGDVDAAEGDTRVSDGNTTIVIEEEEEDETEVNNELVSVDENQAQVPIQVCNNNIPVNVLGVQVPVQDFAAAIGLIEEEGTSASNSDSCKQAANAAQIEDNEFEKE